MFDGRIGVCVTETQITDVLPSDIANDTAKSQLSAPILVTAESGKTFFVIRLTITRIEGTHLTDVMGYEKEGAVLYDTGGKAYNISREIFNGMQFTYPHDIRSSYEFVVGAKGRIAFEIPVGSEPASLKLVYSYQETLAANQSADRGEITIKF